MTIQETKPEAAVHITRTFEAPREKVFQAWTDPEALKQWWGPEGCSCLNTEMDLRVGGEYRHEMKNPGGDISAQYGTYREVHPPERLVFTAICSKAGEVMKDSVVTVEFHDRGGSTEVVVTHEGIKEVEGMGSEQMTMAWNSCLDKLAKVA